MLCNTYIYIYICREREREKEGERYSHTDESWEGRNTCMWI